MKAAVLNSIFLLFLTISTSVMASSFLDAEKSFAEEYKNLRILLEKVQDKDSALLHKQAIESEIQLLNQNHRSGADQFKLLSAKEKDLFVKKFQQNRYHCGDVTQVMVERKRILFNPELSSILRDTLSRIP